MSALDALLLAFRNLNVGGVPVAVPAGVLKPQTLNLVSGATVLYNANTQAFDITIGATPQVSFTRVTSASSPYNCQPNNAYIADLSTGSVVFNLPTLAGNQYVTILQDPATAATGRTVTINGPAGTNLAQPIPNNWQFSSSYSYSGSAYAGTELTWFNGGSSGGYLLR